MKITTRCGAEVVDQLNETLVAKAVTRISRLTERIQATGAAVRTRMVDNVAQAHRHAHSIGVWLRRRTGEARDEVLRITGELADLAAEAVADARRVVVNARRYLSRHPKLPGRVGSAG